MLTQRTVPRYPSRASFQPANMLTRNTIPFPPGFPFYTTMKGTMTPIYPPGLHIDPDVVRRQSAPRFIADFAMISNMDQENMPQSLPKATFNSTLHDQPLSSLFQYYNSNVGTIIRYPRGLEPPPGGFMIRPSQNTIFDLPLTSEVRQQRWSTQAQASEQSIRQAHGLSISYQLLGKLTTKPGGGRNLAIGQSQDPISNTSQEENQQQRATCLQAFSNSAPDQQACPFFDNSRRGQEKRPQQTQVSLDGDGWDLKTEGVSEDKPPQLDNWGLPNTDLKYYNEGMPHNPHMLDLEYVEENPRCIPLFSPKEALAFGTWTDWKLNNRIRHWMIEQDLDDIANSVEEVWNHSSSKDFVTSSAPEPDHVFLEDAVQVWESVSSTKEGAEFNQQLHEKTKFGLDIQVIECLEGEEDWILGEASPDMACVMEEGW